MLYCTILLNPINMKKARLQDQWPYNLAFFGKRVQ